jgi:hypothetical protein
MTTLPKWQPHEKPIRSVPRPQPERNPQRIPLRRRKPVQPIQQRRAQLLQARERKLHLRLHTNRPRNPKPRRRPDRRLQQRRLANPWLAADYQNPALRATHLIEQPLQRLALDAPAVQHLRRPRGDHATPTIPARRRCRYPRRLVARPIADYSFSASSDRTGGTSVSPLGTAPELAAAPRL